MIIPKRSKPLQERKGTKQVGGKRMGIKKDSEREILIWRCINETYSSELKKGETIRYSYSGEKPCLTTFPYRNTIFGSVAHTGQT